MPTASEGGNMKGLYALFCKINSLCSNGEPNFLGWAVIVAAAVFLVYLILKYLGVIRTMD